MAKEQRTVIRYSLSFKRQVISEVEQGKCLSEIQRRYGIKGSSTIQKWIRRFGKDQLLNKIIRVETMEEKDRVKQLEEEVKKLKLALADTMLAKRCLEVVIDEANREYKTDLKKSFGNAVPAGSKKSSG
jgi:transposase-like protein